MNNRTWIVVACLWAAGCAESGPIDKVRILKPGRDMTLTLRSEFWRRFTHVKEQRHSVWPDGDESPHIEVRRIETPEDYTEWYDLDVDVAVSSAPGTQNAEADMTVSRARIRMGYDKEGNAKQEFAVEYRPRSADSPPLSEEEEEAHLAKMLDGARFVAVVDPNGRVVSAKAVGEYWNEMEEQLTKAPEGDAERCPQDVAIRLMSFGVFPSLDDALAYLPPADAVAGQSWTVCRDHVVPYSPSWAFCMMMEGGVYGREESTCRLKGVWSTLGGKIAEISITGKRVVLPRRPDESDRVVTFEITGRAEVNLTTGAVEKLRIENVPVWGDPGRQPTEKARLVHEVSLKPR